MLNLKWLKPIPIVCSWAAVCAVLLFVLSSPVSGAESDPKVVEAAKAENGEILAFMGLRLETARILADRFKEKYPFIKSVDLQRGDSLRMLERALSEYRAGMHRIDVFQMSPYDLAALRDEGVLTPHISPVTQEIEPLFKDDKNYWTDLYWYPVIIAYNTDLVSPEEAPKTWQDLLDPKWKGKIGMPRDQVGFHRVILQELGEEKGTQFMKDLAAQDVRIHRGISDGVTMLAAGEFHINVTRAQHIEIFKGKGAPVEWVKDLDPMAVHGTPIALAKNAPNPNSAKLFLDFVLSDEGAEIIAESRRLPPRLDVKGLSQGFREMNRDNLVRTPDEDIVKNFKEYRMEFRELFGMPN